MRQGDGAGHGRGRISGHLTMLAAAVAPAALGVLTASLVATAAPGATLTLSPDHGAAGASFSGTWQYAANRCPVTGSVDFVWDGATAIGRAQAGRNCTATASSLSPPPGASPGSHRVDAVPRVRPDLSASAAYSVDQPPVPTFSPLPITPGPTAAPPPPPPPPPSPSATPTPSPVAAVDAPASTATPDATAVCPGGESPPCTPSPAPVAVDRSAGIPPLQVPGGSGSPLADALTAVAGVLLAAGALAVLLARRGSAPRPPGTGMAPAEPERGITFDWPGYTVTPPRSRRLRRLSEPEK